MFFINITEILLPHIRTPIKSRFRTRSRRQSIGFE